MLTKRTLLTQLNTVVLYCIEVRDGCTLLLLLLLLLFGGMTTAVATLTWWFQTRDCCCCCIHYNCVTMGAMASKINSLTIVYSTVDSGADQRKHQSSASLAFVMGIHRWPANSTHKRPVTRIMFPFDDVIMWWWMMALPRTAPMQMYDRSVTDAWLL